MERTKLMIITILSILFTVSALADYDLDIESGMVWSGYNDIRIPGDTGTKFSASEELSTDPANFVRTRLIFHFKNDRDHLIILFAPLKIEASGQLDRELIFEEKIFPSETDLKVYYKFNSYRITWARDIKTKGKLELQLGVTGKVRDAAIKVESEIETSEKTNVGFVPLIYFSLVYPVSEQVSLVMAGDALAAPQGRAEDVFFGVHWKVGETLILKSGYRILEGGADNDEVYNFTMLNYFVIGTVVRF